MANVSSSNGLEKYPKLRFKGFSEPWNAIRFGDIVDEYSDRTKEEDEDILLSAAIEGMFLNSELFDHQRGASNKGYKKIDIGTLVLSTQNLHLGNANVNLRFEHGMVSPAYKTYHIHDCSIGLIAEWVKSEKAKRFFYDATTVGASVCRRNVEWDTLYDQPLYLPSEAEQERLAAFLTALSTRIKKQTELVEHLKKYKRGVYKSIFANSRLDCKWISLGELCEIITKGTTPQSFLTEGTIRYIKIESIVDGHIVNENCKFIDQDTHEGALSRSILKEGDILFSIAGSLGVCVIVQPSNLPANTNQALAIIRLKETENRNYILSVLRSSLMEEYILASRTTGAQPNLSLQQMRDFKLPYPNSDEQQKIALLAELMEKRLSFEQRKLENLIDIKSALLQQLFI